jgi:hypothetical protein
VRPRSDTLLVWTGAACSYGCSACPINPTVALPGIRSEDLLQGLAVHTVRHGRLAVLLGGEPFLRSDVWQLLGAVRGAGFTPGIVTTGRPLVYPRIRERLRRAGLGYLRIQLFGIGDEHDRAAAVPGAFEQALAGLQAWFDDGATDCDVDAALCVRARPPTTIVSEVEELARRTPSPGLQIVVAIDRVEPDHMASLRDAVAALASWNADATGPMLAWEGLPESMSADACPAIPALLPRFIASTPRASCLGATVAGAGAVAPRETRANSFNFVRTAIAVPWSAEASACAAHTVAGGLDPVRHIWLVEDDRLVLYATDTADFARGEIARVKSELCHLFVDRAPPGVLDDFAEGMRRVLPDATCEGCADRAACGRRFCVVEGQPFAREETWIADYVARLRGRVLDVGCGEQLYRDQIGALVRSGTIEYTGLDPDERSLAAVRAAFPEARLHAGQIEDFDGEPASFDHILCLRALNHVADVDEALARMAVLLAPAGSLLLVECTPFALLRCTEQVAAADRTPRAGQQHLRNMASGDVLPFARRRSLRVVEHRPASLGTSNEWIMLLTHASAAVR